jgi:hypothetical protein
VITNRLFGNYGKNFFSSGLRLTVVLLLLLFKSVFSFSQNYTIPGRDLVSIGDFAWHDSSPFTSDYTINSNLSAGQIKTSRYTNWINSSFPSFEERTGNQAAMLVGKGSTAVGSKIWAQSVNVTAGNIYTLTFWARAVQNQNVPVLYWAIDGTQIGSSLTLASGSWQQVTVTFTATVSGYTTIAIINSNRSAGNGNTFAIDDVSMMEEITPVCSGNFYDTGEANGDYGNNEEYIKTYCAPYGKRIRFAFTSFRTRDNNDQLAIYDGMSTSSNNIGWYQQTNSPGTVTSTNNCLTFYFKSNNSGTHSGWASTISCIDDADCEDINQVVINRLPSGADINITNGATLYPSDLPASWNIEAITSVSNAADNSPNYSVGFSVNGSATQTHTENTLPYQFAGDNNPLNWGAGIYNITATLYRSDNLNGKICGLINTRLEILNCNLNGFAASANSPVCTGQTLNLSAGAVINGATYSWTGPNGFTSNSRTPSISNVNTGAAGTYTVTITSGSCTSTSTVTVSVTESPVASFTYTDPNCGLNNGAVAFTFNNSSSQTQIQFSLNGGSTYPHTFNDNAGTGSVGSLAPGTYNVYVRWPNGSCATALGSQTLVRRTGTLSTSASTAICYGNSATMTASLNNAVGSVTYAWSNGLGSGASKSVSPTTATVYSVTGTDAQGCTASGTIAISVNPLPSPVATGNSPVCVGGTINLQATGGVSYSWTGPGMGTTSGNLINRPNATFAMEGTYTVAVTDANGCQNTTTAFIDVETMVNPTASLVNSSVCVGQNLNLQAGGGISYYWTGPNGFTSSLQNPIRTSVSSAASGVYTVTVSDAQGCKATASVTATVITPNVTASNDGAKCEGLPINFTASGGTSYSWTGPNGFTSSLQNPTLSTTILPLSEGTYTVTAQVLPGCSVTATTELTLLALPNVGISNSGPVCKDDNVTLNASGGVSYSWIGPNGFSATGANPTITSMNSAKTGIYTVSVQNASGCTATATTQVQLSFPNLVVSSDTSLCAGGTIRLRASGGLKYQWSGPNSFSSTMATPSISSALTSATGIYTVTVENALGCTATASVKVYVLSTNQNIVTNSPVCVGDTLEFSLEGWNTFSWSGPSGFSSSDSLPRIPGVTTANSGLYSVTASVPECTITKTITATVNPLPVINTPAEYTVCLNSNLTLGASGGISYLWVGPNGFTSTQQNPTFNVSSPAYAGVYMVTVTNANGCVNTATTEVTVSSTNAVASNSGTVCVGAEINLSASGGVSYAWTGPNGFTSSLQNPVFTATASSSGIYTVTVTNEIGCTATATTRVIVSIPSPSASTGEIVCEGLTLNLFATGGQTYSWTGPGNFASNQQNPSIFLVQNNRTGTFFVTATDSVGCTATASVDVVVNSLPSVTATGNSPVCAGQNLQLNASSGGVSYSWSGPNGFLSSVQNPLITSVAVAGNGTYTVQLTDANGCSQTSTTNITVHALPVATASTSTADICVNQTITLTASGGNSYAWVGPDGFTASGATLTRNNATVAMSGVYTVTVTGIGNCTSTATVAVYVNTPPIAPIAPNVSICGAGTATLTASGCSGVYRWYTTSTSTQIVGTGATFVTPTLTTSGNGGANNDFYVTCTESTCPPSPRTKVDVTVLVPPTNVTASNSGQTTGHNVYTIAKLFGSATNAVSYSWTGPGGFSSNLQNPVFQTGLNSGGVYTLTATAANGCTATATTTLVIHNIGGLCSDYISLEPTNPGTCSGTNGSIRGQDYGAGLYELSLDGVNWKRSTWTGTGPSDGTFGGLGVGRHLVFVRDRTTKIVCNTVYITLISNGGNFFTGATPGAASECFALDGSIQLQGVLATDEVSWTGFQDRNYVSVSTLASNNRITNLEPGTYYVRVKRFSSIYCYKELQIEVPNNGADCDIGTYCSVDSTGNKFVNGDFGSGTNFQGPPLPEDETDYGYVNLTCNSPNDGFYTIVNAVDCNGPAAGGAVFGTWDIIPEDHTPGDVGGYMMVVNASYEPDVVVEQRITGLCPNSQYNFTAWVRSLTPGAANHINPNFAFLIDGVGKYTTGNVSTAGWHQVGFSFKTGNYTEAVFSIRNNATGGLGNDWVIDDIVVNKCPLSIELAGTTVACLGGVDEQITATVTDPLNEFDFYKWQRSTNGGVSWTDVSGVLQGTYVNHVMNVSLTLPTPVVSSLNGIQYRLVLATEANSFGDVECIVTSSMTQIVVPPITVSVADAIKCLGNLPITLTAVPSGGTAPYFYTWSHGLPNSGTVSVNPVTTTDYILTVRDADNCPVTDTVTVVVEDQPVLTVSISEDSVCLNGNSEIIAHVAGGSGDFKFTWYSATTPTGTWTVIPGETDSSYTPPTNVVRQIYYRVFVEDLVFDCNDATSNAVLFNVVSDPLITIGLPNASLCIGGELTLQPVITGGTGVRSYQWQSSSTGTGGWTNISGATSQTFAVPSSVAGITYYRLTVTSTGNGCTYPPSDISRVEVLPVFTVTINTISAQLCAGGDLTLRSDTSRTNGTVAYQWYRSSNGITFAAIAGATGADYEPNTDNAGINYYFVQATASGLGCGTASSDTARVTIMPVFEVAVVINDDLACFGEAVKLSADTTGGGGIVTYQWLQSSNNLDFSYISGATDSVYYPPTTTSGVRYYKVQATSSEAACGTITSESGQLEVLPELSVAVAGTDPLCEPDNGSITFTFSDKPGVSTIEFSIDGGLTYPYTLADNLGTFSVDTLISGTYLLYARWGGGFCPVSLGSVTISDRPAPQVTVSSVDPTCNVDNGSVTFAFPDEPTRTQLEFSLNGGSSYLTAVNDNLGSYTYSDLAPGVYHLWVRWENNECPVDLGTRELVNHPSPALLVSNDTTICIGESVVLTAGTLLGDAPFTYVWNNGLANGTSHTVSPAVSTDYSITVTDANGCVDTDTIRVRVNPLPVVTATGGTFCEGDVLILSATGGVSYTWSGPAAFTSSDQNPERVGALPSYSGTYTVVVTDVNGCVASDTAQVIVFATPPPPLVTDGFVCGSGEVTLKASGCEGGVITWFNNQYENSSVGFGTTFVTDNLNVTQTYFVNCTDAHGCTSTGRIPVKAEVRNVSNAEVLPINSTCIGEVALNNGVLLVTGFRDGERYSFNEGITYDPVLAMPLSPALIPVNGRIHETIPNPVAADTVSYTVQIISTDGCPTYQTVQFERQCEDCLPYCEPASVDRVK